MQLENNKKYIGTIINGTINSVKNYGFFVNFELEGKQCSGFAHVSQLGFKNSAAKNKRYNITNKFNTGLVIKAEIIEYQEEYNQFLLSWINIPKSDRCDNYLKGSGSGFKRLHKATEAKITKYCQENNIGKKTQGE